MKGKRALAAPVTDLEQTTLAVTRLRWLHGLNGRGICTSFDDYAPAAAFLLGIDVGVIEGLMRCGLYQRTDFGWWFDG